MYATLVALLGMIFDRHISVSIHCTNEQFEIYARKKKPKQKRGKCILPVVEKSERLWCRRA